MEVYIQYGCLTLAYIACFVFLFYPFSEVVSTFVLLGLHVLFVISIALEGAKRSFRFQCLPVSKAVFEDYGVEFDGSMDIKMVFYFCAACSILSTLLLAITYVNRHDSKKQVTFKNHGTITQCDNLKALLLVDTLFLLVVSAFILHGTTAGVDFFLKRHDINNVFYFVLAGGIMSSIVSIFVANELAVTTGAIRPWVKLTSQPIVRGL